MRLIRRLVLLAIIGAGGVAAYDYWSDHGWPIRTRTAAREAAHVRQEAVKLANRAVVKASVAADKVSDRMSDSALTAKIKSKMALDDRVNGRAIDVDTAASVVTVSGRVASNDERDRAVRLALETEGVRQVVDRLEVRKR